MRIMCLATLLLGSLILSGCKTNTEVYQEFAREAAEKKQEKFKLPSSNRPVGVVDWIDLDKKLAVIKLGHDGLTIKRDLISRDDDRNTTAVFQPTAVTRDNHLGVAILYGYPKVGEEVVLRGDQDLKLPAGTFGREAIVPEERNPDGTRKIIFLR